MAWSFTAHTPVYFQVAERIKHSILSGEYSPGEQIPSVRQLALEAAVNPNTVQHSFSYLEYLGLIESHGTLGRFVTENVGVIEECRLKEADRITRELVAKARTLNITNEMLIKMIADMKEGSAETEECNG